MSPFSLAIISALVSLGWNYSSYADSWTITQTVSVHNYTEALQKNSSSSVQAFNSINLDPVDGVVTEADQKMLMGGNDLTLRQEGGTSNKQAVNMIAAAQVVNGTQSLSGADTVLLSQSTGTGNLQVVNAVITSGAGVQIDSLSQNISANTLTFSHQGVGSSNIQAGNYIEADSINSVDSSLVQNFTVQTLNYIQDGTDNIQAANLLIKNAGFSGGQVEQNFNVDTVNVSLPGTLGNNSIAVGNHTIQRN